MSGVIPPEMVVEERAECGCLVGTYPAADGRRAMALVPCSLSCELYQFTIAESGRQGKAVEFHMVGRQS